jgi:regulator of protease activity HflC (stomatin/prohibitin superfamily)
VGTESDGQTRKSSRGGGQAVPFLLVALVMGILSFWLGGPAGGYVAFLLFGFLFILFFAERRRGLFFLGYFFLAVALLVGGMIYGALNNPETVAQISDLPLIGSLLGRSVVRAGLSILIGGVVAGLVFFSTVWLILFISAEWMLALRETYELDRKLAMKLLLFLMLGTNDAYMIVEEGEVKFTKPKGPLRSFGAPAVMVLKPYNAVVLERSGNVTRIEGPGLVTMRRHERIKAIVDLRTQGQTFESTFLTKDNVPLKVQGLAVFRIESASDAREHNFRGDYESRAFKGIISGTYPVHRRSLYRAVYGVRADRDWRGQTIGEVTTHVSAGIRELLVDEIFLVGEDNRVNMEQSTLQDIIERTKAKSAENTHKWGVKFYGMNIFAIEMPEEVQKEFLSRWKEPWKGWIKFQEALQQREVAEIEAGAKLIEARAKAEATYIEGKRKAQAMEEQYSRVMRAVIGQVLDIKDRDIRVQTVLELVRCLQPVDRRVLDMLLRGRSLSSGRSSLGLPEGSSEEPEEES